MKKVARKYIEIGLCAGIIGCMTANLILQKYGQYLTTYVLVLAIIQFILLLISLKKGD